MQLTRVQEKASNPKNSIWLSASAGTGKTHVLIIRFLRLLLAGNKISSILCLTYTKAAANEMKERVFKHLKAWSLLQEKELKQELLNLGEKDDELLQGKVKLAQTLFETCLNDMSYIKIQTIHAFCTNLLSQFPLEAEVPLNFSQSEESAKLLQQALIKVLEDNKLKKEVQSYADNIENIASFINPLSSSQNLGTVLKQATLKDIFKSKELCQSVLQNLKDVLLIDGKKTLDDIKASYGNFLTSQELKEKLQQLKEHEESVTGSNLKKYLANVKLFLSKSDDDKKSSKTLLCKTLLTASKDEGLRISSTIITKKDTEKTGLAPLLQELANELIDQEEALLKYSYYYNIHAKINLAFLVNQTYEELKQEKALLDYDDILYKTLALFKKSDDIMPWVFYKLDSFISHIMVDEAQDTNPIQWQIIKYLSSNFFVNASNNNTLFVVGDIKQSIYSFQGASPLYFNKMFNYFAESFQNINKKLLFLSLNTSFRSSSAVTSFTQFFCNKVFDKQIPYYEKEDFTHNCHKTDEQGFVQIWPLLKKLDKKDQEITEEKEEIAVVLARKIADKIQDLVRKEGINPADIIVLSDRRKEEGNNPVYKHLRRFLAQRKIPYKASDRIKLSKSVFVQDMVALTSFLSQVYDSYSLAGVLKSPIFALSNQDIFDLQANNKHNSLWQNLQNNLKYQEVTTSLLALLKEVDVFSPYHIFSHLLYKQKVLNNYVSRLGQACVEDIEIFLDICLDFEEKSGSYSLDLFLEALEDYLQVDIKQEESEKSNQVIISTIHYFKGLEAKYVFLIDQINARGNKDSFYFVNKENESFVYAYDKNMIAKNKKLEEVFLEHQAYEEDETKRKNYVAITRAINGLFVCNYALSAKIDEVDTLNDITQQELLDFGFVKENGGFAIKDGFVSDVLLTYKNNVEVSKKTQKQEEITEETKETTQEQEAHNLDWVNLQITAKTEKAQESEEEKANFTDDKATEIGTLVHDILDLVANFSQDEAVTMLENYLQTQEIEAEDKQKVKTHVLNVIESDFYNNMLKHKIYTEASIAGLFSNKLSLNRVDAFYIDGKNIYIIDYKTSKNNESVSKVYKEQLLFYKQRFLSVFPSHNVHCYLFFTSNANVVKVD